MERAVAFVIGAPCHVFSIRTAVIGGVSRDESPKEGMLKHTLDALLRTHITAFEALWEHPERLPNGLWKWDVRHSMWVERQKVRRAQIADQPTRLEPAVVRPDEACMAHVIRVDLCFCSACIDDAAGSA